MSEKKGVSKLLWTRGHPVGSSSFPLCSSAATVSAIWLLEHIINIKQNIFPNHMPHPVTVSDGSAKWLRVWFRTLSCPLCLRSHIRFSHQHAPGWGKIHRVVVDKVVLYIHHMFVQSCSCPSAQLISGTCYFNDKKSFSKTTRTTLFASILSHCRTNIS